MNDLEWIKEQCEHTDLDVKRIKHVCRYFGHRTIQSYVDKLHEIKDKHRTRLINNPNYTPSRVKYYEDRIENISKNVIRLQLMADTHPENLFGV